ncbi:MAG: hypothetical protein WEC80_01070 [Patescibacteria group bacterium]
MEDRETLEKQAIDAAINSDWKSAIKLNNKIVSKDKKNLNAFLRLGFAYMQKSEFPNAKKNYKKALKLQPKNQLAQDSLERIQILEGKKGKKSKKIIVRFDPNLFLEIPGKTKSINLVKLGQKSALAQLTIGQIVELTPKKRKIEVRTEANEYLGSVPDDVSKTLYLFIKGGNKYKGFVQDFSLNNISVFIKEVKKGKKYSKYTSFTKDMQHDLARLQEKEKQDASGELDDTDVTHNEIDSFEENLAAQEEKIYLPYSSDDDDSEEE